MPRKSSSEAKWWQDRHLLTRPQGGQQPRVTVPVTVTPFVSDPGRHDSCYPAFTGPKRNGPPAQVVHALRRRSPNAIIPPAPKNAMTKEDGSGTTLGTFAVTSP
jgi:hypothetical protein